MGERGTVILTFDGGSLGNPGRAYGSFQLETFQGPSPGPKRLRFGHGTNNQAEYRALLAGLRAALQWASRQGLEPGRLSIEIRGDSQLVINQLAGQWKVKDPDLRRLHSEARGLVARFRDSAFVHQPREVTVRVLGH